VAQVRAASGRHPTRLWLLLLPETNHLQTHAGQGLRPSSRTQQLGASGAASELTNSYRSTTKLLAASARWKAALKFAPGAACASGSLCAPGAAHSLDEYAIAEIATSPIAYSSLNPARDGVSVVPPPRPPQAPCFTCAAFAAAVAAEAAVASEARVDASRLMVSIADLYFCSASGLRSCKAGWTLEAALEQLRTRPLLAERCLPYRAATAAGEGASQRGVCMAGRACGDYVTQFQEGFLSYRPLREHWEVQQHIRRHGAVVTRFDIWP